ncbi:MAG: helix-turn-helix domain-containing protein, partial [Tateyamaria sp.]
MRDSEAINASTLNLPAWVPDAAVHYLAHTEAGLPIRELARKSGCHASTVLRQIRRFETRRDDPLVDAVL